MARTVLIFVFLGCLIAPVWAGSQGLPSTEAYQQSLLDHDPPTAPEAHPGELTSVVDHLGDLTLEYAGSGGWSFMKDLIVLGDYGYCSDLNGLMILDVTDLANPTILNQLYIQEGAGGLALANGLLYIAVQGSGFRAYDLADSLNPVEVLAWTGSPKSRFLEVRDNLVFLGRLNGVEIIDISNISQLRSLSYFETEHESGYLPRSIGVYNDIMYIAAGDLWVMDIADPESPIQLDRIKSSIKYYDADVEIIDTLMYLAQESNFNPVGSSALKIYSLVDPMHPIQIADYDNISGDISAITIDGQYVFAGAGQSGILIFDVADPADPQIVGCHPLQSYAGGISVVDDTALIMTYRWFNTEVKPENICSRVGTVSGGIDTAYANYGALVSMDISDKSQPTIVGSLSNPGGVWSVDLGQGLAFVNDALDILQGGVSLLDVSGDNVFPLVSQLRTSGVAYGTAAAEDIAYITSFAGGVTGVLVVDISDPSQPIVIDSLSTPSSPTDVFIQDELLYIASGSAGLLIADISVPAKPQIISQLDPPVAALEIVVDGDYVYVAGGFGGLNIVDISDPSGPVRVSGLPDSLPRTTVSDVAKHSNILAATSNYYIHLFDVSDPTQPLLLSRFAASLTYGAAMSEDYLFLASHALGLEVFNISNPTKPVRVAIYDTPGWAIDVAVDDQFIYLADSHSLLRLRLPIPTDVEDPNDDLFLPTDFELSQNYPNPFNPSTTIHYSLFKPGRVQLSIFNVLGQQVTMLVDSFHSAGSYQTDWDGRDNEGIPVASGVYLYKLTVNDRAVSRKMLLLK